MCVFRVFANIPITTFTFYVLIKTFTMHVEDVSLEIAKSAVCLSDIALLLKKRSSAGIMKRFANKC